MVRLLVLALLMLSACGTVDFENAPRGTFEGAALVVWVGPAADKNSGDGRFLYVPRTGQELTFLRDPDANVSTGNAIIRPEPFYTDGGSIPRAAQAIPGFNAWGYGPAYIIHDWLFVAYRCVQDGMASDAMKPVGNMDFQESADVMAEMIKTLAYTYDFKGTETPSGPVIANVVAGPVSRSLWEKRGQCKADEVSDDHKDLVKDINGRAATLFDRSLAGTAQAVPFTSRAGDRVVVVGVVSLDAF